MSSGIVVKGWGTKPNWGIYASIFLVSAALLTLEVSLTRLFSYTVWYHFAYLTISVALLGFGSSGALVAAFPRVFERQGERGLTMLLIGAAVLVVGALLFLTRFPLEVNNLLAKPFRFSMSLLSYYAVVSAPFLLGGFGVALPFSAYPQLMGRLYFWDLLGASLGCASVVLLVEQLGVPGLIIAAAGLLLCSAAMLAAGAGRRGQAVVLGAMGIVTIFASPRLGALVRVEVTSTKGRGIYREAIRRGDAYSKWTALNRIDAYGWNDPSKLGYWSRTGLNPKYAGSRPDVGELMYDGSNGSNIYRFRGTFDDYRMLDQHILRTPYLLVEKPKVLVIGVGGGIDMLNAIKQGASHVTGVELQPKTVYLLREHIRDFTGGFYDRPDVELVAAEGRHFVRKTNEIFDLIQITAVDTFAAQATGAYVLAESYLYTVEAQVDFLQKLAPDGVLSMVVGDLVFKGSLPPLATRLALNSYRALKAIGISRPSDHMIVLGAINPGGMAESQIVLVRRKPFAPAEVDRVKSFQEANGFRLIYAPGGQAAGGYPLAVVLGDDDRGRQEFLDAAWFSMDPVYDDNPFFYNIAKWKNFSKGVGPGAHFPGSFVGQLVLLLMLVQSLLFGTALILLPLARGGREGLQVPGILSYLIYFLSLGVGFMFIEISFVQSFVLFLGSPVHALSVTIFSLLLFSSLGSLISTRFTARAEHMLSYAVAVLVPLIVVYVLGLNRLFQAALPMPFPARVLIATLAQLPLGLSLGMFMPLGIACIGRLHARLVPWAWGINGVGSVAGTTLAVILAMSWGFRVVALLAAGLYLVGTGLLLRVQRQEQARVA